MGQFDRRVPGGDAGTGPPQPSPWAPAVSAWRCAGRAQRTRQAVTDARASAGRRAAHHTTAHHTTATPTARRQWRPNGGLTLSQPKTDLNLTTGQYSSAARPRRHIGQPRTALTMVEVVSSFRIHLVWITSASRSPERSRITTADAERGSTKTSGYVSRQKSPRPRPWQHRFGRGPVRRLSSELTSVVRRARPRPSAIPS
jgi:hypothetical protein